jgi:hypothetical protein
VTAWTPRPPAVDEPACWSWPVPPLRDAEEEFQRLLAEQAGLPRDEQRVPEALRFHLDDMVSYRFGEFHGVGGNWSTRCAICGGRATTVDHCHDTGQVRGWLCRSCNVIEGRSRAPIIVRYRRLHPAAILDLHEMYNGFGWDGGWWWGDPRSAGDRASGERSPTPWPVWSPDAPLDAGVPC